MRNMNLYGSFDLPVCDFIHKMYNKGIVKGSVTNPWLFIVHEVDK